MDHLPASLRAVHLEDNNLGLEIQTLSPTTTHGQATQVTADTNIQTTVDQDIVHTNTPSADAPTGNQNTTSSAHCMAIRFGGSHSIPVPFSNHDHAGGEGDESDDDDDLPDYDDSDSQSTDDESEVPRQASLHHQNIEMTAQQEVEFLNRIFGDLPEGSTNLNSIGICANCGRINATDGTPINHDHAPGSCTANPINDVQAEDEDEDEDEDEVDFYEVTDSQDYTEPGDESDESDTEEDETRLVCSICSRRLALICFTPCTHFFCTSCALGIWWSGVRYPHHWPLSMPCPLCRDVVEDVIDEGGVVIDLLWWVLLVSERAQERAMIEDVGMIISAHAQALVRNM
ncbi:uncharacterized protein H6S33_007981 [Morchella sextelata]|uniref:uncharacterized protein n=1 Tax=Morchella sextelata TaxID=1174677 RepID=UPI001D0517C6|nr:uncharacterized protein H6S33_007981 [Morchella sextelata]KAH0602977.1 hypothetical protein H6S33_007981 [Morchella sextelata]